ncbi:MAG: sigma-54-dependent Fis family transcriptional regulator, partial [Deltaproteobacteria bacterium]
LEHVRTAPCDLVVVEWDRGEPPLLDLIAGIKRLSHDIDVVAVLPAPDTQSVIMALRAGADDYLIQPLALEQVEARLGKLRALREARQRLANLRAILGRTVASSGIVAESAAMRVVWERIELFADATAPVLITGEKGTGKELIARTLHERSQRAGRPLVVVPCGAMPENLIEDALFGRIKRGFAGAPQRQSGRIEQAQGGTLVLKNADRLSAAVQARVARLIQTESFRPGGAREDVQSDVRIIATTTADLSTDEGRERFDGDFLCLLRGLEIPIPPLRERKEDVLPLARHFLAGASGPQVRRLSGDVQRVLLAYEWPGNVGELRRVVETAAAASSGEEIRLTDLPRPLRDRFEKAELPFVLHLEGRENLDFHELVDTFQNELLEWAMKRVGGQQTKAAALLHIPRTTLQSKLWKARSRHSRSG